LDELRNIEKKLNIALMELEMFRKESVCSQDEIEKIKEEEEMSIVEKECS
jgi:hypothetical protein